MGHPLMYTNVANEMPVVPIPALLPRYKGPWPIAPTCDAIPNTRNSLWRIGCEHVVVLKNGVRSLHDPSMVIICNYILEIGSFGLSSIYILPRLIACFIFLMRCCKWSKVIEWRAHVRVHLLIYGPKTIWNSTCRCEFQHLMHVLLSAVQL